MSWCAVLLCRVPVDGLALICNRHRAERVKECKIIRSKPTYKPANPDCTFGYHALILRCKCHGKGWVGGECKPCTECHYCGLVHHFEGELAA